MASFKPIHGFLLFLGLLTGMRGVLPVSGYEGSKQRPGIAGTDKGDEMGKDIMRAPTQVPAGKEKEMRDQMALHSLMVNSSLKEALAAVQGLKSQVNTVSDPSSRDALKHAKQYQKDINADLDTALTHQQELKGAAQETPGLAQGDAYSSLITAVDELKEARRMWIPNFDEANYFKNKTQVNSDLTQFEKQLNRAIELAGTFNKEQLKLTHEQAPIA